MDYQELRSRFQDLGPLALVLVLVFGLVIRHLFKHYSLVFVPLLVVTVVYLLLTQFSPTTTGESDLWLPGIGGDGGGEEVGGGGYVVLWVFVAFLGAAVAWALYKNRGSVRSLVFSAKEKGKDLAKNIVPRSISTSPPTPFDEPVVRKEDELTYEERKDKLDKELSDFFKRVEGRPLQGVNVKAKRELLFGDKFGVLRDGHKANLLCNVMDETIDSFFPDRIFRDVKKKGKPLLPKTATGVNQHLRNNLRYKIAAVLFDGDQMSKEDFDKLDFKIYYARIREMVDMIEKKHPGFREKFKEILSEKRKTWMKYLYSDIEFKGEKMVPRYLSHSGSISKFGNGIKEAMKEFPEFERNSEKYKRALKKLRVLLETVKKEGVEITDKHVEEFGRILHPLANELGVENREAKAEDFKELLRDYSPNDRGGVFGQAMPHTQENVEAVSRAYQYLPILRAVPGFRVKVFPDSPETLEKRLSEMKRCNPHNKKMYLVKGLEGYDRYLKGLIGDIERAKRTLDANPELSETEEVDKLFGEKGDLERIRGILETPNKSTFVLKDEEGLMDHSITFN